MLMVARLHIWGGIIMNKLSKIFLGIIIVIALAFSILMYKYINLKKSASYSLEQLLKQSEELQKAYMKIEELENKMTVISNTISEWF